MTPREPALGLGSFNPGFPDPRPDALTDARSTRKLLATGDVSLGLG